MRPTSLRTPPRWIPPLGLLLSCSGAATAADPGWEDLERALGGAVEAGQVPGAVVLVGRGEETLAHLAEGARVRAPAREALEPGALFDLASLTKPVATATAVMLLVDREQVELDEVAARYLPEFRAGEKITVRQLLQHRGGLVPDNPLGDYGRGVDEAWRRLYAQSPTREPGTAFVYSDVGFQLLGALVERVDGRGLDRFCAEEIFAPLGMADTGFRPGPELAGRCAPTEEADGALLVGVVHDPRARALGGVAGHAGLFSTAQDLARWCRMLLRGGAPLLSETACAEMLRPSWLADGTGGRALGLDVDTGYSSPRGRGFPRGASLGHTGFTGTSLWLHPESGAFVVLLTSRLYPDGGGSAIALRREVGTLVAEALLPPPAGPAVLAGIDVLARDGFGPLAGRRVALLTNRTGRTADGARTIDVLHAAPEVELVSILTPEHGLAAAREGGVADGVDLATGLSTWSLYGETRRPTEPMLAGLDAVVFDVQDVGARYYTYATTLGYLMEACGARGIEVLVLDRPNPIRGDRVQGPRADPDRLSFISYQPIPVAHGMTLGELARLYVGEFGVECGLTVVPCEGWRRSMWFDETGLTWVDPSPNMRNPTQALLYPAIGLLEACNLSVGRGTDQPFELLGAPWVDGVALALRLNGLALPGLRFTPIEFTPDASVFEGEACRGVYVQVVERDAVRAVEAGFAVAWCLLRQHPDEFEVEHMLERARSHDAYQALLTADHPRVIAASWADAVRSFEEQRASYLLYSNGSPR